MIGPAYNPDDALTVARLCDAIYERNGYKVEGHPHFHSRADIGPDSVAVFNLPGVLVVIFRGTINAAGWRSNLKATKIRPSEEVAGGGKIHKGFWRAADLLAPAVMRAIDNVHANDQVKPVVFGGHSRGGALAMITAWMVLAELRFLTRAVYTYGSPRWCDKVMARNYDMRLGDVTWKHVNNNDAVPHLPPWRWGWQHVGRMVYIDRKQRLHIDTHRIPFADRLRGALEHFGKPGLDSINDHGGGDNFGAYLDPLIMAAAETPKKGPTVPMQFGTVGHG